MRENLFTPSYLEGWGAGKETFSKGVLPRSCPKDMSGFINNT
jgi:hypothetical protein